MPEIFLNYERKSHDWAELCIHAYKSHLPWLGAWLSLQYLRPQIYTFYCLTNSECQKWPNRVLLCLSRQTSFAWLIIHNGMVCWLRPQAQWVDCGHVKFFTSLLLDLDSQHGGRKALRALWSHFGVLNTISFLHDEIRTERYIYVPFLVYEARARCCGENIDISQCLMSVEFPCTCSSLVLIKNANHCFRLLSFLGWAIWHDDENLLSVERRMTFCWHELITINWGRH